jgi:hypothetical protein
MAYDTQKIHEEAAARVVQVLIGLRPVLKQLVLVEARERLAWRSAHYTHDVVGGKPDRIQTAPDNPLWIVGKVSQMGKSVRMVCLQSGNGWFPVVDHEGRFPARIDESLV